MVRLGAIRPAGASGIGTVRRGAWRWMALPILAGCGGGDATAPPTPAPTGPGLAAIRFVSGMEQSDTIDAVARERLVLEVRDTLGRPWADVPLLVGTVFISDDSFVQRQGVQLIAETGTTGGGTVVGVRTDAQGRVAVRFRFGPRAGPSYALAALAADPTIEAATVVDTRPGRPSRLELSPRDTALYVGGAFTPTGRAFDRAGALLPDPVTARWAVGTVELREDGRVVALALGRGSVTLAAGGKVDSIRVGVPPQGTIAAVRQSTCGLPGTDCPPTLMVLELDGSGVRPLGAARSSFGVPPAWTSDGVAILTSGRDGVVERVVRLDVATGEVRPLVPPAAFGQSSFWGRVSRDGEWLFFSSVGQGFSALPSLWRWPVAGGAPERLGLARDDVTEWRADPSPDGRTLAYVSSAERVSPHLVLLDLATGTRRELGVAGHSPRWSPDGSRIAYATWLGGGIRLLDADGTNPRLVSQEGRHYGEEVDWSPDGAWLIARGQTHLELLPVAGGEPIPLFYSSTLLTPAFRP